MHEELLKINFKSDEQVNTFFKFLLDTKIEFEKLQIGNYLKECPNCDDDEFWFHGHCSHCGFNAH